MLIRRSTRLCAITSAAVALCAGAASAQVANPSFETAGDLAQVFADWTDFGNSIPNIYRDASAARTGSFGLKMFGQFTGDFNASGVFQDFPTSRGQTWDGSVWAKHLSTDPLIATGFGALNVEFRGEGGQLLEYYTIVGADALTPTDTWFQRTIAAVAPENCDTARIVCIFLQPDFGDTGAILFDDASLDTVGAPTTDILNPGFEQAAPAPSIRGSRGWAEFGNNGTGNIRVDTLLPRSGAACLAMYGQFTGSQNYTGVYQSKPCAAGDTITAEIWSAHPGIDPLAGGNAGSLNVEFYDASNALIEPILTAPCVDGSSTTDTYFRSEVVATAPANAVRVRLAAVLSQPALGTGNIFFDDAALTVDATPPSCPGDANGSGNINGADLSVLLAQFGTNVTPGTGADFNGDGFVNGADLSVLLSNFGTSC